jgi:hypothetical protein
MKLSEFLLNIGRPVAFYPGLVKALGDRNEAIFICQMAYWRGKESNKDGWIYKTSEEIEGETSLSYKEQIGLRKGMKEKGLLEENYARTEHKMYFRVNWDKVNEIWEQFTPGNMPHMTESHVPVDPGADGSLPGVISLNGNTESTPESTPETPRVGSLEWDLFHGKKVTQEELDKAKAIEEAPRMFETSFGFGKLPWSSNSSWNKLQKFITEIYVQDRLAFGNYVIWRAGDGKYKAMSNKQIRMNPQIFMDTGWMEFMNDKNPAPVPSRPPLSEEERARKRAIAAQLLGGRS